MEIAQNQLSALEIKRSDSCTLQGQATCLTKQGLVTAGSQHAAPISSC